MPDIQSDFLSRQRPPSTYFQGCPTDCLVQVENLRRVRSTFHDLVIDSEVSVVHFRLHFVDYTTPIMETYPYMSNSYLASRWVWASENYGRRILGLPLDGDVLSLYILDESRTRLNVNLSTSPANCLVMSSPECRLRAVRNVLIHNVTNLEQTRHRRDYLCHYAINNTECGVSRLVHRCCETDEYRRGDVACETYTANGREMTTLIYTVYVLAGIVTLFSPVILLRIKMALKFTTVTKFFRASLKHGITGQRNYVIRISSRQLIDLSDKQPFSLPGAIFRLVFHGYGEGRCCIHWWSEWPHQPGCCRDTAACRRWWFVFTKVIGVLFVYPIALYSAVALYGPKLYFYRDLVNHTRGSDLYDPISLDVNVLGSILTASGDWGVIAWVLFSFCAFIYTTTILSWPDNPLERCLLRYEGKRPFEQPSVMHRRLTQSYKSILFNLAYGPYPTKRHFFRVPWFPWGIRRVGRFLVGVLSLIPIVNICFTTFMYDAKIFDKEATNTAPDKDEAVEKLSLKRPPCRLVCKWCLAAVVWLGFVLILAGYCTTVFLMVQFLLSVTFFVVLGSVLNASLVLPWVGFAGVIAFYLNDHLSVINAEHCQILRLIDENSPRISAVEDLEGEVFRQKGVVQVLKTHNLGAVKFIDADNTAFVSKELYYSVCSDLKQGWSSTSRRIFVRLFFILAFTSFLFAATSAMSLFVGSQTPVWLLAVVGSAIPKALEVYAARRSVQPDPVSTWAKAVPDILDRHIRVDRSKCLDEAEGELTTYDVRPIGVLEMDLPQMTVQRTLRLWKFSWSVSCDQQTAAAETFLVALANKLAAAAFLSQVITRAYSTHLEDETVLRQWCLMTENCIIDGSTTVSNINGTPLGSVQLFPPEVQPLVSTFDAGNTIDSVVDAINRELYGPFTKGVLVTIGNTSFALCKLDSQVIAFNSASHGDQATDFFGAVLVLADFNTQNLQSTVKYLIDPYRPDAVPVYSIVPVEGFVFKSPEILEIESVV